MRIILTGGGTGGHFYPLIAVAEEIRNITEEQKMIAPELYYIATSPYNPGLLYQYGIEYRQINTGKIRHNLTPYNIFRNFIDLFRIAVAACKALWQVFTIYPDVVFGKGGYSSFPTLFASILLGVPVVIHESDSVPGRVNAFIGKFATKVAISYPEAAQFFEQNKVAWTGNPIRKAVMDIKREGSYEMYGLEENVPVVLILGGSQGAQLINEAIVDALPSLVEICQILHQAGENNVMEVKGRAEVALRNSEHKNRYKAFPYFNEDQLRHAYGAADLIISRAGSTIFEIAVAEKPAILIPIKEKVSRDQRHNAFSYAKIGGAIVIEENNLQPEILTAAVSKILKNPELQESMRKAAINFSKKNAAKMIAEAIIEIGLSHEK